MRKAVALFLVVIISAMLFSCSAFSFNFPITQLTHQTTTTTRPNTASGTVTYIETNYSAYPDYESPSYSLTVEEYNDVLIASRDLIRRANIQVTATLYEEQTIIPWGSSTSIKALSRGSGVIFTEDDSYYYAITNHHVIDNEGYYAKYEVKTFEDSGFVDAFLVADDPALDLAVIKFAKNGQEDIRIIDYETRAYTKFRPGELVLAVGNPLSLENNVTYGEFINMEAIEEYDYKIIYHSAMINEGSSGGALVDVDGKLLGINTWGSEDTDEESFAVPIHIIYMFLVNNGLINT